MKHAPPGSISSGTMHPRDFLPAFVGTLEGLLFVNGDHFSLPENRKERDRLNELIGEAQDCFDDDGELKSDDDIGTEGTNEIMESLFDALESFAPPDHYFGSHPGDGADFGFWPVED